MADVFLSYKRKDAPRVRKLVGALREAGLDVWWDDDIPASAPWESTIERALADAKAVIVCWSPDSVASENVRSEARVARADGRLVQVFLMPCTPPLFFGERQGIDLTSWRGKSDDPRIAKLAQTARAIAAGERIEGGERPKARWRVDLRVATVAAALLLLIGSVAGWWWLSPAKAQGPITLAVLPFRALNAADANLVDAIWDDTRGAIGRNPNLRVLGREAVTVLSEKNLDPAAYKRKVGADYLLDGSVQHVADRVEMKLSLVRTNDGSEVWSDRIGGQLDDVFAFQTRIANEVEGRIRGRVAPGGGVKAQNISTNGEVYALYAEAKADVRKRDGDSARQGAVLLRKALAIDPNYAPASAELGVATFFGRAPGEPMEGVRAAAISDLKRALTLAPNLAFAHAALAMVQSFPVESEPELRRAVELDPGNAEAWTWLGNLLQGQNRLKAALEAHRRAAEIEPLWWTTVGNLVGNLVLVRNDQALSAELGRIAQTQDKVLLVKAHWRVAELGGQFGDAIRMMLQLRSEHPEEAGFVDLRIGGTLIQLGFLEEGLRARKMPLELATVFRGVPVSPTVIDQHYKTPLEFWQDSENVSIDGRLLPNYGRLHEYVDRYRAAFKTPDDFLAAFAQRPQILISIAPNVIANLRAGGEDSQAEAILRATEPTVLGTAAASTNFCPKPCTSISRDQANAGSIV